MGNTSDGAMKFGFNKPKADDNEQINAQTNSPVEGGTGNDTPDDTLNNTPDESNYQKPNTSEEDTEYKGDKEYTARRSVTVMLVKNYSLYRKANDKVLPKRKDFIGSSIQSSRVLSSNKEEVDAYFPNIIGLSPADPNFVMRVKQYLNNIRVPVDELGRKFDISFHYYRYSDYKRISVAEDKIEEEYANANKQSVAALRAALKEKITKLNVLESTKHKLGYPINVDDYLLYRHCLLYNDVAKDMALINVDSNVRFYFQDDQKEADRLLKYRKQVNRAKTNYVACLADEKLFEAVYIQYCVLNNLPVAGSLSKSTMDKEIELDKFSNADPVKFNKICANRDVTIMGTIEKLIARGELVRTQYNQNITTSEGEFIGANISEAVIWFKNPDNVSAVGAYMNKLKNI